MEIARTNHPIESSDAEDYCPPVVIRCRLIPFSQAISFVIFFTGLSICSTWATGSIYIQYGSWIWALLLLTKLIGWFIIPVLICTATTLKLTLSEDGIEAGSVLHKETLYKRRFRPWSDLHAVRLRKTGSSAELINRIKLSRSGRLNQDPWHIRLLRFLGKGWNKQGFLFLDFTSGGMAAFPLAGFSPEDLENLFLAFTRWCDPMTLNPDVLSLQKDVFAGEQIQLSQSYTQMWEQSLQQRFEVTNFVPLNGGQTLANGQFTILMLLACGGFSSVYLARNASGDRVVIKEMAIPGSQDEATVERVHKMFAREAAILAKLNHPFIVRILDYFVERGRDYVALEFVPGLTLRQHVEMRGVFSEDEVRSIGTQIAELLKYLHSFDPPIIHRDVTPDNFILREPDRKVMIIDFGAANECVAKVTGTLIGKQCYIPPEQFQGRSTPQSDIYSAGATLHFLLTGEDPEPISESHPQLIKSSISQTMDEIVAKATAIALPERVGSAAEFEHLLDPVRSMKALAVAND